MKNAGDQRLIRNTFNKGFLPQAAKIFGREPNADPGILLEHGFSVFPMPILRLGSIL